MDKIFAAASKQQPSSASLQNGATTDQTTQSLPAGVVLGKDGKPCRTCTDSAAWKALMSSSKKKPPTTTTAIISATTTAAPASSTTTSAYPSTALPDSSNCPPDVALLGRSSWTLLHTLAASYPAVASREKQSEMTQFLGLFSKLYPCWVCAEDFQKYMRDERPVLATRGEFGAWLCRAHNAVNVKLGKEMFDCARWEERWREGWGDGSCD